MPCIAETLASRRRKPWLACRAISRPCALRASAANRRGATITTRDARAGAAATEFDNVTKDVPRGNRKTETGIVGSNIA